MPNLKSTMRFAMDLLCGTVRAVTGTFVLVIGIALAVPTVSALDAAAAVLPILAPGQDVSIRPSRPTGRPVAHSARIENETATATSVSLRGTIEGLSKDTPAIVLYGHRIVIDSDTRVPSSLTSLDDLTRGRWVKVTAIRREDGTWRAQRVRVANVRRRPKIEGPLTESWGGGPRPDSVALAGFVVRTPAWTRVIDHVLSPSERIFREVLYPIRPGQSVPWLLHERVWSRGRVNVSQSMENEFALGSKDGDRYRETEPQLKLEFGLPLRGDLLGYVKLRSRREIVIANAPLRSRNRETAIQAYEAYLLWRDIAGQPFALQVGRQDFDDDREWLYDDQLDAIRLYAYPFYPFVGQFAYVNSIDDSPDNKYRTTKDYVVHLSGRVASGVEASVYRIWRTDADRMRGREPVWTGLQVRADRWGFEPWLELSRLRGWDKHRRFQASAFDIGTTVHRDIGPGSVSLTAGLARGSGNPEPPRKTAVDRRFVQTGYEDNTGNVGGVVTIQYYGEVFDPELSNMKIVTLGGGYTLHDRASLHVLYHSYQQVEHATTTERELESTDLTWRSDREKPEFEWFRDIGWELDAVVGIKRVLGIVDVKWIVGVFDPDEAVMPDELAPFLGKSRSAILSRFSLEYRF